MFLSISVGKTLQGRISGGETVSCPARNIFPSLAKLIHILADEEKFDIGIAFPEPYMLLLETEDLPKQESVYRFDIKREILNCFQKMQMEAPPLGELYFCNEAQAVAAAHPMRGKTMYLSLDNSLGVAFRENYKILCAQRDWMPAYASVSELPFRGGTLGEALSETGIENLTEELLQDRMRTKVLHLLAVTGSRPALEAFRRYGETLCEAIQPFLQRFAPDTIVLTGVIAKSAVYFMQALEEDCIREKRNLIVAEESRVLDGIEALYSGKQRLEYVTPGRGANPGPLQKVGAPPLHTQLRDALARQIEEGIFPYGALFWSERQLQEAYGVSRMTVRLAVGELVNDNYLLSARGVGSKVCYRPKEPRRKPRVTGMTEKMRRSGIQMETSECEIVREPADNSLRELLELPEGAEIYRLTRLRKAGGVPMVYITTYMNGELPLPLDPAAYDGSLYELLREDYGVSLLHGRDTFEAVLADGFTSAKLNIQAGAPVVKRTRRTLNQNGTPYEYSLSYYPGDIYKYSVEL